MAASVTYDAASRIVNINSTTGELNTCEDVVRSLSAINASYVTSVMSFTPDNYWTGGIVGLSAELRCNDNPTCNLTFLSATKLLVDREPAGRSEVLQVLRQGSMIIREGCLLNFNTRKQTNRGMFVVAQGKLNFLGTETNRISCESPANHRIFQYDGWTGLSAIYVDHYNWCSNSTLGRDQSIGPQSSPQWISSVVYPTLTNKNYGWVTFDNCRMYPGPYWESLNGLSGANSWAGIFVSTDLYGAIIKDCHFYKPYRAYQSTDSSTLFLRCTAENSRDINFFGSAYTLARSEYNNSYNFVKCNLYNLNNNQRGLIFKDCLFKDTFLDSTNTTTNQNPAFIRGPFPHLFTNCVFDFANSFYDKKDIFFIQAAGSGIVLEDAKRPNKFFQGGTRTKRWVTLYGVASGNNSGYVQGYFTKIKVTDKNNTPISFAKVIVEQKQNKEKHTFYTNIDGEVKSTNGQDIFLSYKEYYGKENTGTGSEFLSAFGSAYWSDGIGDQYHIITAYKEGYESTIIKAVIDDEKEFNIKLLPEGAKIKTLSQRKIDTDANTYIQATNCKNPKSFNDFILALKKENYWDKIKQGWIFGSQYNTSTQVTAVSTTQIPFKGTGDIVFVNSEIRDYGFYMTQNNTALSSYAEFPLLGMHPVSGVPFFINAIPLTPNPATGTNSTGVQDFIFYNKSTARTFAEIGGSGTGSTSGKLFQIYPNLQVRVNNAITSHAQSFNLYTSFSWNIVPSLTSCVMFNDAQQTPRLFIGSNDTVAAQSSVTTPIEDSIHRFAPRNTQTATSSNAANQFNVFIVFNSDKGLKASESFRLGEILESTLYSGITKLT